MKALNILIFTLFTILLIALLGNVVLSILGLVFEKDVLHLGHFSSEGVPIYIKLLALVKGCVFLLFCLGVFYLMKILNRLSKSNYFSEKHAQLFKTTGVYFIISGILGFCSSLYPLLFSFDFSHWQYLNFDSKNLYIVLIIVGLFFIVFGRVTAHGYVIKKENDLTI
ncbi:DUF2975 domain-containing protein [Mangrovimonas cancribranchiae]|uniref:DUF2975 domain-containing protein n=1 Tax=Mangrovimonas cancribranchiae TaxID=3080055 RepID=A0AAU6NVG6_9FLAO